MQIITNNKPRLLLDWNQLSEKEQAEFDYINTDEKQACASFVRYRGCIYDLGEFMRIEDNAELEAGGWQGYSSDSYFSGVLIKVYDNDHVIMGTYYY